MKVSTKGRYGLRAMMDLARKFGKGPIMMSEIAEQEDLSPKYLHALLASLRASGLIRSVRGAGGGYMLAKSPDKIPIDAIITALEGPLELTDCVSAPDICIRGDECAARRVWLKASEALQSAMGNLTLSDLIDQDGDV